MPLKEMLSAEDQGLLAQEVYQRLTTVAVTFNPTWTTPLALCATPPTSWHPMYGLLSFDIPEGPKLRTFVYPELSRLKWSTGFRVGESALPSFMTVERIARLGRSHIRGALIAARRRRSNNAGAYRALRARSVPLLRELKNITADPRLKLARQKLPGAASHYRRKAVTERIHVALKSAGLELMDLSELHRADPKLREYLRSRTDDQVCTVWNHLYRFPELELLPDRSAQNLQAIAIARGLTAANTARQRNEWLARANHGAFEDGPRLIIAMGKARSLIHGHVLPGWDVAKVLAELIGLEPLGLNNMSHEDRVWLRHAVLYLVGRLVAKLHHDPGYPPLCLHDTPYTGQNSFHILGRAFYDADINGNTYGQVFLRIERAKVIAENRSYDLFCQGLKDLEMAKTINNKIDDLQSQAEYKVSQEAAEAILDRAGTESGVDQELIADLIQRAVNLRLKSDQRWLIKQVSQQICI